MLTVTTLQPRYKAGENPDEVIAEFLLDELRTAPRDGLIVLPEYSNAGGLSDKDRELSALPRAQKMLEEAAKISKEKCSYVAINVLENRNDKIKNSTYLFDKNGDVAFVYDKQHLPQSEIELGVERGNGSGKCDCLCVLDDIRFAFMTCYDVYFNEQIEHIAKFKPDIIVIPGYQRGERTDIIRAQAKLLAFRCNAFVVRSSYSMDDELRGGCSMIVSPTGEILRDMGKEIGSVSETIDYKYKYMRTAGFGGDMVRNDDFISAGMCPEAFL